jgi:DNA adenine methylase
MVLQYMGGKFRIVKPLTSFLEEQRAGRPFVEPFVGAAWVTASMSGIRISSDIHPDLILMWQAIQAGWIPPSTVTEEEYNQLRTAEPSALRGFVGFGCSFAGKWFGGYARSGKRNYALNAKNSCIKLAPSIQSVQFLCRDYQDVYVDGSLIYCDPPYEDTTGYFQAFDWVCFWNTMREWTRENLVYVSSYKAPPDFACVAEFPTKTDMRTNRNGKEARVERLFSLRQA